MPKVLNIHKDSDRDPEGVYIGRPSVWGNPFVIGRDGTREQVITKYEAWLLSRPELVAQAKQELRGKNLRCFCAPAPCHGDVLLRIANAEDVNDVL